MTFIAKLYYHLTAYVPRKLPTTPAEYARFEWVLMNAFGVKNEPQVWTLVAGFICSVHAMRIRASWGGIANAAKRLDINNLAQFKRKEALNVLNAKLLAAIEAENERTKAEGSHDQEAETLKQSPDGATLGQASPEAAS